MSTAISHNLTLGRVVLTLPQPIADVQPQQWQRRVTDTLERISLYPAIPPQAIVVVRQIHDPLPGGLLSDHLRDWGNAAQSRLEDCWREAVRPVQGPVPPSANAVWFADRAEWLACLSWDIHQGIATQHWWWKTWMRQYSLLGPTDTLVRLWQSDVQWLPQTLTLLYQRHGTGLSPLLARLSSGQAYVLRQEVAQAYFLPPVDAAQIIQNLWLLLPLATQNLMQGLPTETQALVALSLGIVLVPSGVQQLTGKGKDNSKFKIQNSEAIANLLDVELVESGEGGEVADHSQFNIQKAETIANLSDADLVETREAEEVTDGVSNAALSTGGVPPHTGDAPRARVVSVKHTAIDLKPEPSSREMSSPNLRPQEFGNFAGDSGTQLDKVFPHINLPLFEEAISTPTSAKKPSDSLTLAAELGIFTGLGGLWYLVNVLADLDWLVDSTNLTGWHKLLTLAQALLPEAPPDGVWSILTELAGEECPEMERFAWLEPALPAVKDYLSSRFDSSDDLLSVIADILQESATLYVTRTHIDVIFTLNQIRLDARVAGLDRNPGWVPELARVIAFHYE
jgi:hypothetical protein